MELPRQQKKAAQGVTILKAGAGRHAIIRFMDLSTLLSSEEIKQFCQKHHIRQLSFFGSVVRDDFGPHSDIDILVEFEPGHVPGLDFFLMESELSQMFSRRVDLQTLNFLSPEIRTSVLAEAIPAYEQA